LYLGAVYPFKGSKIHAPYLTEGYSSEGPIVRDSLNFKKSPSVYARFLFFKLAIDKTILICYPEISSKI
jgi:hypothetical protein